MGLTKKNQQLFAVTKDQNSKKRVENLPRETRKPVNHWAILDGIEAPMWVDLMLECDSTYEDKDDEWFNISHPYHQCSAQQLISALSLSAEHRMNSGFDLQDPTSPKLPSSVSKSRGKDYKSRKQELLSCRFTLNKQLPVKSLSCKSSLTNKGSITATEKNAYDGKVNDHRNHVSDSVDESTLSQTTALVYSKSASSFSDKSNSAKSVAFEGGESNSTGTITLEATAGKHIEACTQPWLLSNIRDNLRKSYVTRQASRVEIKCMRQVEGQESSSSKSSVGSSSRPGCHGINPLVVKKSLNSLNIKKLSQLPVNRLSQANVHRGPTSQAQKIERKSYLCMNKEANKTMDHRKQKEGCVTQKVNVCKPLATANSSTRARGINSSSRTIIIGKENQSRKVALAVKSSMRLKEAVCSPKDQEAVKRKMHQTSGTTKLVGPRDNRSSGSNVLKSIRKVEPVYFR